MVIIFVILIRFEANSVQAKILYCYRTRMYLAAEDLVIKRECPWNQSRMTCLSADGCFSQLLMDHTDKIAELALNNNHSFTIHSPKFCKNYVKYLCKHFWGNKLL